MNMMQTKAHTEQFSLKNGLSIFRQPGKEAVLNELKQLHDMEVVEPVEAGSLSREQNTMHWNILCSLNANDVAT